MQQQARRHRRRSAPQRTWKSSFLPTLIERLEPRRLLAVVINEIHYDPDIKTQKVEFIELYNSGPSAVDLTGWRIDEAVDYTFPAVTLPSGQYLVITQDAAHFQAKFGTPAFGQWETGDKLSNEGETIELRDAQGNLVDTVSYKPGFPWPTVGEAPGYSIELVNPAFDNDLGGNWRSGIPTGETTFVAANSQWRFRKGLSEASSPITAWRQVGFTEDSSWSTGTGIIGYDNSLTMNTYLSDMNGNYSCVFLRKTFTVSNPATISGLRLEARYDDGFNVWINGQLAKTQNTSGENLAYTATASVSREDNNFQTFTLDPALLQSGTNIIAVQFFNISLSGSSDAFFDARLIGTSGGGGPSPGQVNKAFAANIGPQMRQLKQSVQQPVAGQDVTITIKATDPDGVAAMTLDYQLVDPGSYIRQTDAAYSTSWTTLAMHDDGLNGDATAGDNIYSVVLPGSLQTHRRLVRYRINATDSLGATVRAPYVDDSQPNFAYFVYNGVPSWTGANRPGVTTPVTFGTDITNGGVAVYHLIASSADVTLSQYNTSYENVDFLGTMVYDGVVYDHIKFSVHGQYSTYVSGKNKWHVSFNNGHDFAARDNYGNLYKEPWGKLVLNANASPWVPVNRGMAGLDEAVSFRLFQLAGMQASNTNYVEWRVIDDASEPGSNQYLGDLWGLYLAVENPGGKFTDQHDLPDGNIYKIELGAGDLKNQGADQPSDGSDWNAFRSTAQSGSASLSWWQNNLNLETFYSFVAISRATGNVDLREGDNFIMYHAPDGHWQPMPWDLDMMYIPETHQSGETMLSRSLVYAEIKAGLRNRAREILDLLFSDASRTGGQVAQLVDEYARRVNPSNGAGGYLTGLAELDQYMWNYNPRTASNHLGAFYKTPTTDTRWGGTWTRTLTSPDFAGMVNYVIDFMTDTDPNSWSIGDGDQRGYGFNYLEYEASDTGLPVTPSIGYSGYVGYPVDHLRFTTSSFADTDGGTFAKMEWRIGEISNPGTPGFNPNQPWKYEIDSVWESGELSTFGGTISIPVSALQPGRTYRARVRMMDNSGKWSHWSAPLQFVAGNATDRPLAITELHYHPADHPDVADDEDLEFIELLNTSNQTISLDGWQITQFASSPYIFSGGMTVAPGKYVIVARSPSVFSSIYGTNLNLAPTGYSTANLSNGGERIALVDPQGNTIVDFTYDDVAPWPTAPDGNGPSLEIIDPLGNPADPYNWRASAVMGGSPGWDGLHEITPPTVISSQYDFEHGRVIVQFSEDVSSSIQATDIEVQPRGGGSSINPASFTWDGSTSTATFAFAALLPDGNYQLRIAAGAIADVAGNLLAADYLWQDLSFYALAGDANRDRTVDISDLAVLATNWQGTGKTFSQGDFNYDGTVDITDLALLATNWQQSLAAPAPAFARVPVPRKPIRAISLVVDQ